MPRSVRRRTPIYGSQQFGSAPSASTRCLPPGVAPNNSDALLPHGHYCSQLCPAADLPAIAACQTNVRLQRELQAANQHGHQQELPVNIIPNAEQPRVSLADAA